VRLPSFISAAVLYQAGQYGGPGHAPVALSASSDALV
jgi:hypothetical protein